MIIKNIKNYIKDDFCMSLLGYSLMTVLHEFCFENICNLYNIVEFFYTLYIN